MEFEYLTAKEFEELTEKQQARYLKEKRDHEQKQADKSVKDAVDKMRAEIKAEQDALIEKLNADQAAALEASTAKQAAEYAEKMEAMEAAMKRAKIGEMNIRMKGISEHIIEKLSTPEGEEMIKGLFKGRREGFSLQIGKDDDKDIDSVIKAMAKPVGSVAPEFTPIVGPGHDEFHARNIIPVFPTVSDLVKFLEYTTTNPTAGFGMVDVGGQKPTLAYTGTVKEAPVRKIAGLLDVPDELIDDVVGFRAWIAYELPKAYMDYEDSQIYKGDGTGLNLLGVWYQASNQSFPQGSVTAASNIIDKIVAGITEVRKLKRNTSAVVISPVAWQEIFINKGTTKDYTYPIILDANGVMRIGGVAIFWSNVFADGEGVVGDFARGTAIFQRKAMSIGYFEQNKDNVEKNVITIRLEGREALPIFYPQSFKKLLLTITT